MIAAPTAPAVPSAPTAPASRWIHVLAAAVWLATLGICVALLWVSFGTSYLQDLLLLAGQSATAPGAADLAVIRLTMLAFCAITLGYATVGALLVGRPGAGRIGAILLAGGSLFALVPFGYVVGGFMFVQQPSAPLFLLILVLGPAALGPGTAALLPLLAIAFPDGRLPSRRWRGPVAVPTVVIGVAALIHLVRPDALETVGIGDRNPIGVEGLPSEIGAFADVAVPISVVALTAMGIVAVIVRYRRGTAIERQQARWFVAAVALAAVPLSLSFTPILGGPLTLLVASVGLLLVPVSVGIAVTRYRLYEIDRLISRTLVYVPLTAIVAGLYAAVVALLQRVFQSVTGDTSDAAIVISTLILASVFTPLRKWLEGIVDRRFKPAGPAATTMIDAQVAVGGASWNAQMEAIAVRVVRDELASRAASEGAGRR